MKYLYWILTHFFLLSCQGSIEGSLVNEWAGQVVEANPFLFEIQLEKAPNGFDYIAQFSGHDSITEIYLEKEINFWEGWYKNQLGIKMKMENDEPVFFIQLDHHLCHVQFKKNEYDRWHAKWNALTHDGFFPTLYLDIDSLGSSQFMASAFFKEPSLHYLFMDNLSIDGTKFKCRDQRSRIEFYGELRQNQSIQLTLSLLNEKTVLVMKNTPRNTWRFGEIDAEELKKVQSRSVSNSKFNELTEAIENDSLERTHAVIIRRNDRIVYEKYFDGFTENTMHDTRSVSKSFASAIMGIAIEDGLIENENTMVKSFFDKKYPSIDWSKGKDSISIHHLLTMSSGLDAIDFGLNRTSYANEGNYQSTADWTKHILEAPMVNPVGDQANYGSGSPHLLAPILASTMNEPLEFYFDRKIFKPLEIQNYRFQIATNDVPYFGGGWYFTPEDLSKFGQLYLNEGLWNEAQILSKDWVSNSIHKHKILENTFDLNEYGYLFWHKSYPINNVNIESIECRGTGGQYVFIIPALDVVVVITSGNYFNNKGFQPERIMQEYILPILAQ